MKVKYLLFILFLFSVASYSQDRQFSYIGTYREEKNFKAIADSLHMPLLITADNKVYAIGSDCITRLLDGDITDRDKNGDTENRKKKGGKNDRSRNGDGNDRSKSGSGDDRNKGGDIGYRNKKGNKNRRNKDGDDNDRDKNGDNDDRDKNGDTDTRNADGAISNGPRCSTARNGKILLYTRQDINSSNSNIYYKENFFNNKYFKIIKL